MILGLEHRKKMAQMVMKGIGRIGYSLAQGFLSIPNIESLRSDGLIPPADILQIKGSLNIIAYRKIGTLDWVFVDGDSIKVFEGVQV